MTNTTFSHYWCVHTDAQVKVGPKMTHLLKKMEHGYPLLQAPAINKGDAFTQLERDAQGLQVCGGFRGWGEVPLSIFCLLHHPLEFSLISLHLIL